MLLLASGGAPSLQGAARRAAAAGNARACRRGTPGVPLPQAVPSRPSALDLRAAASELPQLRSLLVSWRGELIAEHYARGARPSGLANIKSASKSIIAALVGIAIERRLIPGVREPIVSCFPELRTDRDPRKQSITIEDLLTMRSGLGSTSGPHYGAWVQSPNWVRSALARPMVGEPGGAMEYSTGSSHLLSAILTKAARVSTWESRRKRWRGRSGSRWRAGRRIRRACTSAETRCCLRPGKWSR